MVLVEVFDHIFIGDVNDAKNVYKLIQKNIGGVVSCFSYHDIEWCSCSEIRNKIYYKNYLIKCKQDLSKCTELCWKEENKTKDHLQKNDNAIDSKSLHEDFILYTSEVISKNMSASDLKLELMELPNIINEVEIDFTKIPVEENKKKKNVEEKTEQVSKNGKHITLTENDEEQQKEISISKNQQNLIDQLYVKEDSEIINNTERVFCVQELSKLIKEENKISCNNIFKIKHLTLDIQDSYNENLIVHVNKAHTFIDEILSHKKNVLVHCFAGISRCSSIILSYISKKNRKGIAENLRLMRLKYPFAYPNENFYNQLLIYEQNDYDDKVEIKNNFL